MPSVELSAGTVEYQDTGGPGPVAVLTHGFPMNHLQWRKVVPQLHGIRCVLPTMPLGGHRVPMHADADLSQAGQARILAEFLERLELDDVALVMNDWGGPQFMVALGCAERVGRLVFVACEAFDNFPPPQARPPALLTRLPGGTWLLMQLLRTRFFRRSPRAWGAISKTPVPDEILDAWFDPATRSTEIRRDLRKFAPSAPSKKVLLEWSEALTTFAGPALVVWAGEDAMMPEEHGPRLAALLPNSRFVEIAGSGTLIPEDEPDELARVLRDFLLPDPARGTVTS